MGPKTKELTTSKEDTIIYLSARGMKPSEIADAVGLTPRRILSILEQERVQFDIKHLRYKLFGKDTQKRFKEILPHAIDIAEKVMMNPNTKPAIALNAAMNFMDRALGKPKQTFEHEGSLIKAIYEKLDNAKNVTPSSEQTMGNIIDVEPNLVEPNANAACFEENPNSKTKTQIPPTNPNIQETNKIDDWVKQNL